MQNFRQPFMGGMPQMGQQGQQGPQMPQGPPQGPPQGAPPPRQGPAQMGAGGGSSVSPALMQKMQNMPQFGMAGMQNQFGPPPQLQQEIDRIQQQLMQAQISGANPMTIGQLQMDLQQAQRAYQEAGMQAMFAQQQARPQPGARGVGQSRTGGATAGRSRANPYDAQMMQDWQNQMQLLMGLWGMGGGGGGGIGG